MRQYRLLLLSIVIIGISAWFLHTNITNDLTTIPKLSDGSSVTKQIFGQNEDEYLRMSAKAELYPVRSEYNVEIVITNITNETIQILTPCGSYVSLKSSEKVNPNGNPCVAVHSMGIEKKESVNTTTLVPSKNEKNEQIILTVTYELPNKNQRRHLDVTLTPRVLGK
jgi:hypothetical protein